MDYTECPANTCPHKVEDHYTYTNSAVRCRVKDCDCGIIKVDEETWKKLNETDISDFEARLLQHPELVERINRGIDGYNTNKDVSS